MHSDRVVGGLGPIFSASMRLACRRSWRSCCPPALLLTLGMVHETVRSVCGGNLEFNVAPGTTAIPSSEWHIRLHASGAPSRLPSQKSLLPVLRQPKPFQHGLRNPGTAGAGARKTSLTAERTGPVEGLPQKTPETVEPCLHRLPRRRHRWAAVSSMLISSMSRKTKTMRKGSGSSSTARSSRRRTSAWAAAASGSLSGRADGR